MYISQRISQRVPTPRTLFVAKTRKQGLVGSMDNLQRGIRRMVGRLDMLRVVHGRKRGLLEKSLQARPNML